MMRLELQREDLPSADADLVDASAFLGCVVVDADIFVVSVVLVFVELFRVSRYPATDIVVGSSPHSHSRSLQRIPSEEE